MKTWQDWSPELQLEAKRVFDECCNLVDNLEPVERLEDGSWRCKNGRGSYFLIDLDGVCWHESSPREGQCYGVKYWIQEDLTFWGYMAEVLVARIRYLIDCVLCVRGGGY